MVMVHAVGVCVCVCEDVIKAKAQIIAVVRHINKQKLKTRKIICQRFLSQRGAGLLKMERTDKIQTQFGEKTLGHNK